MLRQMRGPFRDGDPAKRGYSVGEPPGRSENAVAMRTDKALDGMTTPAFALPAVLRALRIEQWVKNLLVFMPLMMAPEIVELSLYDEAFFAFLSFSFCASAVYVLNDLVDLEADRRHPRKRSRPFASGELAPRAGWVVAAACLVIGVSIATTLPMLFAAVLLVYLVTTTLYTFWLKHVPLVDVLLLALLYTGRVIAGGAATYVLPSPWILGFSLFFFLSLAFVKRYAELNGISGSQPALKVRGYFAGDLDLITINGTVSGYMSVLVAALYINGDHASGIYAYPALLWLICPLLLYWVSRIWMLAHRGQLHEDPVLFAIRDRASWIVFGLIAVVLLIARI
jgi:4-hydroxybenzoate polyprenyltransferase